MSVPAIAWFAAAGALALVVWDLRAAHRRQGCALLLAAHVVLAGLVGAALLGVAGADAAGQFLAGWGTSLAATVDLLAVLLAITTGTPEWDRPVAVAVVVAVPARGLTAFGTPGPLVGATSVVFGAAVLWAAWRTFHGEDGPSRPLPPQLAAVLAALAVAALSASATQGTTGSSSLSLLAGVLALVGVRHVFGLLHDLLARVPDASVGLAVVLVFLGARSVLAGLAGAGPVHDPRVVVLALGMLATVAALGAVTAVRRP